MIKLLPLQGVLLIDIIPRAMPWARSFWAFSPYLNHMRKFSKRENKKKDCKPHDEECNPFKFYIFFR